MNKDTHCIFETVVANGETAVVKCSRCGLTATVPSAHADKGIVYASCRGTPQPAPPPPPLGRGPGTELKKLLAGWPFYITSSPDCSCNRVAAEMDAWGPDECEKPERMDYILAAMRDNAQRRGLPFLDAAGRLLIRRAIKLARRNAVDH